MTSTQINMISNNGIKSTNKILKMMQYFKNKLVPRRILFIQETHATESNGASWRNEFNATLFSYHGLSNSCKVLIGFLEQFDVNVLKQMSDSKCHILMLNVTIDAKKTFS